jgi:serine/threonine-protein phosphatase 5
MSSETTISQANSLKDEGNAFLNLHKYTMAVDKYSEAIALHPTAIFYSNRAQALIKLESYGSAIEDVKCALK